MNGAITVLQSSGVSASVAAELTPNPSTVANWVNDASAPAEVTRLATELVFAANAFRFGVVGTIATPALEDDPHAAFTNPSYGVAVVDSLTSILHHFYEELATYTEPVCSHAGHVLSLADNVVLVVAGDTYKDPFVASGWPDGTPANSNLIYVRANGWLVPGWFGQLTASARATFFDPLTGNLDANATFATDRDAAALAILYAITRGNVAEVAMVGNAPYAGSVAKPSP